MKQKSQAFRNKIRKREMQQYFSQKRKVLRQTSTEQNRIIIIPNTPISSHIAIQNIEPLGCTQTQADFTELWRISEENIGKYLAVGTFQLMINIFQDIHLSLKKIISQKTMSNCKKNQLLENFLRTSILSYIVRSVLQAHIKRLSPGQLVVMTHTALKILSKVLSSHSKQFTQSLFLESDLLKFLASCLSEPKFDKKHIQLVMNVIVHMIIVSRASTGQLFQILNSKQQGQFNLSAIFYNISNINLQPNETITQNFIIMMNHYFTAIEEIQHKNKSSSSNSLICLNSHQMSICFEITLNSVDYYIKAPLEIEQNKQFLDESMQLLKFLIEHTQITSKWLDRVNYKRLISLLSCFGTTFTTNLSIIIIIDHLIFADPTERFPEFFVRQCNIISTLWGLKNNFFNQVINIFANLASIADLKPQLSQYCHQIFMNLRLSPNYLLYQFIYNWFNSQDFIIIESKDRLAIAMLQESEEISDKITNLESMIWYRLAENNQISVPRRILQFDNQCSKLLNRMLGSDSLEEEV